MAETKNRRPLSFALSENGVQWLDSMRSAKVNRTDVLRACLAVARKHGAEVGDILARLEDSRKF